MRGLAVRPPGGFLLTVLILASCQTEPGGLPMGSLTLAPDFRIDVFAIVPGAESLVAASDGTVHVATNQGEIVRLDDQDGNGIADGATRLGIMLEPPVTLALGEDGEVVALARDRIVRFRPDGPKTIVPSGVLPPPREGTRHHLARGPDGRLYVSLGQPCAGCRGRSLAASILEMRPDGHELRVHVRALRRPGALDWHPKTERLAFTDEAPGRIARERAINGLFGVVERPILTSEEGLDVISYVDEDDWIEVVPELRWTFAPGLVPAGVDFYAGDRPSDGLRGALLVTLNPVGESPVPSQVVALRFAEDGRPEREDVLVTGWRGANGAAWGRPVDVEEQADGSVLIADDRAGVVYRLARQP